MKNCVTKTVEKVSYIIFHEHFQMKEYGCFLHLKACEDYLEGVLKEDVV